MHVGEGRFKKSLFAGFLICCDYYPQTMGDGEITFKEKKMPELKNIAHDSASRTSENLISVSRNASAENSNRSADSEDDALWNRSLKFYEMMNEASN